MEEQTGLIHATLSEILNRFGVQTEKIERLAVEVKHLGKQVEMQQDNLDEVKRTHSELLRQPPTPPPPPPPPPIRQPMIQ